MRSNSCSGVAEPDGPGPVGAPFGGADGPERSIRPTPIPVPNVATRTTARSAPRKPRPRSCDAGNVGVVGGGGGVGVHDDHDDHALAGGGDSGGVGAASDGSVGW
jgi:hypothetical protein